mgnify:CR=1 FL=1
MPNSDLINIAKVLAERVGEQSPTTLADMVIENGQKKQLNYEININLIQTFKGLSISEGTRFEPNNPVFIIKAKKK